MSSFPQFSHLSDDLMMHIVSFVADAPFEKPHEQDALTHVLPYVCKKFLSMSRSQYIWKLALERLSRKNPDLWEVGLLKLLPRSHVFPPNATNLVEYVHDELQTASYRDLYRRIVQSHIRVTYPVFCMNGDVSLNEPFGLHFFEPRYRILISEAMEHFPVEARQGNPIEPNEAGELPTFCYAHAAPFAPTSPACLVQVRTCHIHPDGTADVLLVPTSYVWIERIWERPNTGRLHQARCIRMGEEPTRQMEEDAFRARERRPRMGMPDAQHSRRVQNILQFLMGQGGPMVNDDEMHEYLEEIVDELVVAQEDHEDGYGSEEEEDEVG